MKKKKTIVADNLRLLTKHHLPTSIDFAEGTIMLVNKPLEWTSFDAVNRIKYALKYNTIFKKIKIGHAGTLDPMAEGLLIICTGKYTKLLESLSGSQKSYEAIVKLGVTTASFDRESVEENQKSIDHICREDIEKARLKFLGKIQQIPPIFSAIKIKGQTAYNLARRGEDIVLKSREVDIIDFNFTDLSLPLISFDITVSKGTYIRSIAHDIGQELNVGGYLAGLKRTSVGSYLLADALELEEMVDYIKKHNSSSKTNE